MGADRSGSVVEVDHLMGVGEPVEPGPHAGVIEPGAPVQHQQRRSLGHARAIRRQFGSNHVEEEARAVDLDVHAQSPRPPLSAVLQG